MYHYRGLDYPYVGTQHLTNLGAWHRLVEQVLHRHLHGHSSEEEDNEDGQWRLEDGHWLLREWPPMPPWRVDARCEWASFVHRLLLRQDLRDKHEVIVMHDLLTLHMSEWAHPLLAKHTCSSYGDLVALANGSHPLSTLDRGEMYFNGPPTWWTDTPYQYWERPRYPPGRPGVYMLWGPSSLYKWRQ